MWNEKVLIIYDDVVIFRPDSGLWAVRGVSRTYFGSSRDMAITERDQNYNRLPVIPIGGLRMSRNCNPSLITRPVLVPPASIPRHSPIRSRPFTGVQLPTICWELLT